jgi:putative ABC transport system ATP-binding protein
MNVMNPPPLAVRLRRVTRAFGSGAQAVHALRGADLDIEPGRLVMLAGPSGCGKTTLLSVVTGLLTPTAGEVEVFGVRWSALGEDEKTRLRGEMVGYVFQRYHLVPTLSVLVNVAVPLLARGVRRREAEERAARALEDVGLGGRLAAFPRELSGGQQQRVALARALVGRPRLLVCDEPTAHLDADSGHDVMQLIRAARRGADEHGRPRCALVVTHDYRALRFADIIYQMEDGTVRPASASLLNRVRQAAAAHNEADGEPEGEMSR